MQDQNGEFFVKGGVVMRHDKRLAIVHNVLRPTVDHNGYVVIKFPGTKSETGNPILEYVGAGLGLMVLRDGARS